MTDEAEGERLEATLREATRDPEVVSFAGGFPAVETFPREQLIEAARAVLSEQGVATSLQYVWPEGEPGLREWVAERLNRRGIEASAEEVIITSGAQQALSLAADLTVEAGSRVLVDAYCYPGALELFRARDSVLSTRPDEATCTYQMPGVTNPLGDDAVKRNLDRLLTLDIPIIADEAYGELRFDGAAPEPLRALAPSRVFMVGSVSKSLCPGLRVGWLVPPRDRLKTALENKRLDDLQASTLSQALLMHWLRHNDYDAHVQRSARLYRARATCLVENLRARFPDWQVHAPQGGFSVLVDTGRPLSEADVLETARSHGVVYDPGASFRALPGVQDSLLLRLCYSNLSTDLIERGVTRLQRAWHALP